MAGQYRATRDAIEVAKFGQYRATRDVIETPAGSRAGQYRATRDAIEVTTSGGQYRATRDAIEVDTTAVLPTADPGPSTVVSSGSLVTLDGSGSSTPAGRVLTWAWRLVSQSVPTDTAPALSSATAAAPTVQCPILDHTGTFTYGLTVTNTVGQTSLEATVTVGVYAADKYIATSAGWIPVGVISAGEGAWAPRGVPAAPTVGPVTVSGPVGSQQAAVTYAAPTLTGGSALTQLTATVAPAATVTLHPPLTGTSLAVTGLADGTSYTVSLTAANAQGTSPAATTTFATAVAGSSIQNLTDTFTGTTIDTVKWVAGAGATQNGALTLAATATYSTLSSAAKFTLPGSYSYVQAQQCAGPGAGGVETDFRLSYDGRSSLRFQQQGTALFARVRTPRVDVTTAAPAFVAALHPATQNVAQDAVLQPETGTWYVDQALGVPTGATYETCVISHCYADGTLRSSMTLPGAGHGTYFNLEYAGGLTYIWMAWQEPVAGGNTYDVVRFQYRGGTTLTRSQTGYFTVIPKFYTDGRYAPVFLDWGSGWLAQRISTPGVANSLTAFRRKISDVLAGVDVKYGTVGPIDVTGVVVQGSAMIDDDFYLYTGTSNPAVNDHQVTRYSFVTGALTGTVATDALGRNADGTTPGNFCEPEGISVYRDPISNAPSLMALVTAGSYGAGRTWPVYQFPTNTYADTDAATLVYSATTHAWWRVREASGTVYFDTSPDRSTWTQRATVPTPVWAVQPLTLWLYAGYSGTETAPRPAIFDYLSTPVTMGPDGGSASSSTVGVVDGGAGFGTIIDGGGA